MRFFSARTRTREPVDEIAHRWRDTIAAASAAELDGRSRRHDRLIAKAVADARGLVATDDGRRALDGYVTDPEPAVRTVAAGYALVWKTAASRPVLETILGDDDVPWQVKADAHLTLTLFDNGKAPDWIPRDT